MRTVSALSDYRIAFTDEYIKQNEDIVSYISVTYQNALSGLLTMRKRYINPSYYHKSNTIVKMKLCL